MRIGDVISKEAQRWLMDQEKRAAFFQDAAPNSKGE
jgi:hypothetical protein